ncbi:la-related protein 6-like [Hypomesus transpacificus]|uniref:la-related protein 6-like n=1 Tax=Hypomesus transpacificus TaxID=137520 RepID=UPI001F071F80|nr:la-related protein 6-like [Hypomesus transpacificus]
MESPILSDDKFINRLVYNENDYDIELDDWAAPDANVSRKMVAQIEHYLSDDNLVKDTFLLKHVRRNKMGYVNVKLLTSFKKMKHLTKDWRITAYALQHYSSKLELNKEGNKVRRKDPVPESLLAQVPSKFLLVWNLSDVSPNSDTKVPRPHSSTMETAISILEPFGSICTVKVFRPGRELPPEVQRNSYRYPELCSQESFLVEYEDLEGAGRAYNQLSQLEGSVKVILIGKTLKKKAGLDLVEEKCNCKGVAIVNRRMNQLQYRGDDSSAYSSSESEVASPLHIPHFSSGQVCSSPWNSPRSSPRSSPRILRTSLPAVPRASPLLVSEVWRSPDTSPELNRRNHDNATNIGNIQKPWAQRREISGVQASMLDDSSIRQSRLGNKRMGDTLPSGIVRFPYGPDGTRGFHITKVERRLLYTLKI